MKKIGFIFLIFLFLIICVSRVRAKVFNSEDILLVSDNKILLNSTPIILRGVAVGSIYFRKTKDKRDSEKDYKIIKEEWNANVVRLSMHPGVFNIDKERGLKFLEEEVGAARNQGLFVIIDWHAIGFPNGWYKPPLSKKNHYYSFNSDFNLAKSFWDYTSKTFKNDRGVIFELWNEIIDKEKPVTWKDSKPYMQELYNLIRNNGAKNIVIAPGVYWTYDLRGIADNPLNGANIAYAWHNYKTFNNKYINWDEVLNNLNEKYPVIVTEWGFEERGDFNYLTNKSNYGEPLKEYIIEKKLHYTAWCWHSEWKPRMFKEKWKGLTDFGWLVKDFLLYPDKVFQRILARKNKFLQKVNNFISYGVDRNSIKLGRGERAAVVYSYKAAFGKNPENDYEWQDLIRISNGRWPSKRSELTEEKAKEQFEKIYQREVDTNNKHDNAAIMIMAYGLRQRAENRNLNSEKQSIMIFRNIFNRNPSTTEEWNIMQAIAYSGAVR